MSTYQIIRKTPNIPTEPQDHSKLVESMRHYIEYFKNRNIHPKNIQQYSKEIKECQKLINEAAINCKPTTNQRRLESWQKELLALMSQLECALSDALPDKKLTDNTHNTHNTDTTGNPYFVQILNT